MDKRHSALQEWRQNTLLVILTVVMATSHLSRVSGYPSGPPIDSYPELCSNMLPSGHSGSPSEPPSPYFVSFNETEYTPGQLLEVTLEAILPISDYFKGFLVIVDNTPRTIGPQGEFFNVSEGTQALDCSNSTQNAWGHSNNTIKHTVTAFWKPPAYDQGPLVARATVVKEFSVFWVHILSDVIQYSPPETMLTTTQPPSTDPTESSQATSTEYPFGETTLTSTQPPSTDTTDTPQATSTENPVGETMLTTTQPPSTDPTETPQATSTEPFGELAFSTELGVSIIFTDTPQPPSTSIAVDIPDIPDDEAPSITCPDHVTMETDAFESYATVTLPNFRNATDNVVINDTWIIALGAEYEIGSTAQFGYLNSPHTITYYAEDLAGNQANCSITITVLDLEPPDITCPQNGMTFVFTDEGQSFATVTLPTDHEVSDNVQVANVIVTGSPPPTQAPMRRLLTTGILYPGNETTFEYGSRSVYYIATDLAGNENFCELVVQVNDQEPPTIDCPFSGNLMQTTDEGQDFATVVFPSNYNASDNVHISSVRISEVDIEEFPQRRRLLQFPLYSPGDNQTYGIGNHSVYYIAADFDENEASCVLNIVVKDDEPPMIMCPFTANGTTDAGLPTGTAYFPDAIVTDNSGLSVGLVANASSLLFPFPIGETIVEFVATDSSGNSARCTFIVRITDDDPPMITCPANQTVATNSSLSTVTILLPPVSSASDNSGAYTITIDVAGATHNVGDHVTLDLATGQHLLRYIITDNAMNTETCDTYITVIDDEPPTIMCPFTANGTTDAGLPTGTAYFPDAIVTDNSGLFVGLVANASSLSTPFPIGETIVEFVATDSSGNSARCTFIVRITDDETPVLECPLNIVAPTDPGQDFATVTWNSPNVTDNSGELIFPTLSHVSGSTFPLGITTVEVNATDSSSNVASCSFIIDVGDDDPPMITCPANQTVATNSSLSTVTILLPPVSSASDNSGAYTITIDVAGATHSVGDNVTLDLATGQHLLLYIITDDAMNTETCDTYITVIDDEPPTIMCPFTANGTTDAGLPTGTAYFPDAIVTDNSGMFVGLVANASSLSTPFPIGETIVEFVATDSSGNSARCTFIVRITDDDPPMITCPANQTVATNSSLSTVTILLPPVSSASDNSGAYTITIDVAGATHNVGDHVTLDLATGQHLLRYIITDNAMNTETCDTYITVIDDEPPMITCPFTANGTTDAGLPTGTAYFPDAIVTDNSGLFVGLLANASSLSTPFPIGETIVEFVATDSSGNSARCTFIVRITDDEPPMITCPFTANGTTAAGLPTGTAYFPDAIVTDNSGLSVGLVANASSLSTPFPTGETIVEFVATDSSGNSARCTFIVRITDDEAPVVECPLNIVAPTDPGQDFATVTWNSPNVTDNSGELISPTLSHVSGSTFPLGITTVEVNATDSSSNPASCSFIIDVGDDDPPMITCPANQTVATNSSLNTVTILLPPVSSASDNSGAYTITIDVAGTTHNVGDNVTLDLATGQHLLQYIITDNAMNTEFCDTYITVIDDEPPMIMCPFTANGTTDAGLPTGTAYFPDAIVTDNSGLFVGLVANASSLSTPFPIGETIVEFVATDSSGNSARCTFIVRITDDEAPVLECPMNIVAPTDPGQDFATVMWNSPNVTDNSGELISPTLSHVSGSTFPLGITTVDVNATDSSSNIGSCFFTIDVQDSQAPVVECPMNILTGTDTGQDFATVMWYAPNVTDNSGESITANLSHVSGSTFPLGITTVSVDATDSSGRTGSCSFTVTVLDDEAPVLECPMNIVAPTDPGQDFATVMWNSPNVTDNSGELISPTLSHVSGSTFPLGITTVDVNATDSSSNIGSCFFTIDVQDSQAPVVECPMNIVTGTDTGQDFATVMWYAPNVTDNSGESITANLSHVSGSTFPLGMTTVSVDATDSSGRSGSCSFTVTVLDGESPSITCPANQTVAMDSGKNFATVVLPSPASSSDNSGVYTVTIDVDKRFYFVNDTVSFDLAASPHLVLYTATDDAGNSATCDMYIIVFDDEAPVLECPMNIVAPTDPGQDFATVMWNSPNVTDNSGELISPTLSHVSGSTFPLGITTVDVNATDSSSNIGSCFFTIDVQDSQAPVVECPMNIVTGTDTGQDFATVMWYAPNVTDNSGESITANLSHVSGSTFPLGMTTVSVDATDSSGRTGSCSFTVTVLDGESPSITCPANQTVAMDSGKNFAAVVLPSPASSFDNSGVYTVTIDVDKRFYFVNDTVFFDIAASPHLVQYTATDDAGNSDTCDMYITVFDIDDCDPNPCLNGGTCSDGINSYTCTCAPGYTDSNCTTDIDDCFPDPCLNNGTCSDGVNGFTCECAEGFEGQNCSTNIDDCDPHPCLNGGTCSDALNGYTCTCAPGYTDINCSKEIDECSPNPCMNGGVCTDGINDYTCTCAPGYTDDNCTTDIDDCDPNPCLNGGTCSDGVDSYTCTCAPGYTDSNCTTDIDDCFPDPCLNNGTCSDGVNGFTCKCAEGFEGQNCSTNTDDCHAQACFNEGTCIDGINGYTCECVAGFEGDDCSTNIDDCDPHPCLNGGTCSDALNGYTCTCAPGYTDINCSKEIDECSPNPCMNGGVCTDGINDYTCTCAPGYTDDNCTTDIDDCDPNPCLNGGTCSDGVDSFTCTCAPGYTDSNCTTDIDDCIPDPCLNNGTCSDGVNGFTCECAEGFEGQNCSTNTDDCHAQACFNEGTCIDGISGYTCECVAGFEGRDCLTNIDDCDPDPCMNDATCFDGVNRFTCACAEGFSGENCSINLDDCYHNPCMNNGTCIDGISSYVCECAEGFEGKDCEINTDDCSPDTCLNNGTCRDGINGYTCDCVAGFQGVNCSTNIDDCDPAPCMNGATCFDGVNRFTCACAEGFSGENCSINLDDCYHNPCMNNGTCIDGISSYVCECAEGFEGKDCEINIDDCSPDTCLNNGTCRDGINGYTCDCVAGFQGVNCSTNIDDCDPDPCMNGATCFDGVNRFTCACAEGFSGENCSINLDDCYHNPCMNDGTCIDGISSYVCECAEGFEGKDCEINIDDCNPDTCMNNGTCRDGINGYTCDCVAGFQGVNCSINIDDCSPDPCFNDGSCTDDINGFTCHCPEGFEGNVCLINIDDCSPQSCLNDATCVDGINDFTCECADGFEGPDCATDIDDCSPNPCMNNGTCTDGINGFTCECVAGYDGNICSTDVDDCDPNPCLNGGMCSDGVVSYTCTCAPGYVDINCTTNIDDCEPDPCLNGGTCSDGVDSYTCTCAPGYTDSRCSSDVNECEDLSSCPPANRPCINSIGGFACTCPSGYEWNSTQCTDVDECLADDAPCPDTVPCQNTEGSFTCLCNQGFAWDGGSCSDVDECLDALCADTATCVNQPGGYSCVCPAGYLWNGTSCEDIDECEQESPVCPSTSPCQNTMGSYTCICSAGYAWNGTQCTDVDECQSSEPVCPSLASCTNTQGSFRCHCQDGYTLTGQPGSSLYFCMDIDECQDVALYDCHSNATCINEPGAYRCMCSETQGYRGDGTVCTPFDLCESGPCLNQGQCTSSVGSGSYECVCTEDFTGVNCGIRVVLQGPISVLKHPEPSLITASLYDTVTLECQFENANRFAWYRNGVVLPGTRDVSFLTIAGVTSTDRGYYWCEGSGLQGVTLQTNASLLLIDGVSAFTSEARFPTLTFVDELRNKSSPIFKQISAEIITFLSEGLQSEGVQANIAVKELNSGSVVATTEILTNAGGTNSDDSELLSIVQDALVGIATASDGYMDPSSITLESSGSCVETRWPTIYGTITLPAVPLGEDTVSNSDRVCPDYTINSGQPIAYAVCVGDGFSPAQWLVELQCGRNLTVDEKLALLNRVEVNDENVMVVALQVMALTEDAEMLSDAGVASTADIMTKIADVNSSTSQVTETVVDTVGNLMFISDEVLQEAEVRENAPSRIVRVLERQLGEVSLAGDVSFREVHPNIAVEVRGVTESTLLNGLGFASANSSSSGLFGESSLMVMEGEDELFQGASESEMPSAVLMLPPEVNILARREVGGGIRVSFSVFRKRNLFQSPSLADFNKGEDRFNRTINTRVMSATVGSQPITNLNEPVTILLSRLDNDSYVDNTSCVFWEFVNASWSSEGCRLREEYITDQYIACQCDHLTNFAALMDIYPESPLTETQEFILKLLSLVGCGMSILGLAVTMVTYLSHKKLRKTRPNRILLSLCASLLCLYITFVVATALDSERGVAELDVLPCCVLAGFLHYFTLTSLCWMGVEGFNMYLLFVRVVNVYVPKFMLKASLAAWGIPALIVAITAGATREDYVGTDFCFLKQIPLIAGLLAPIGLILLFNIVVFTLVIRQFIKTSNNDLRRNRDEMSKRKLHKQRLQNALTVMTLMGLTWSIGYLNLVQAISFPVQLVFCLLNTLQGYFIFMLYGVRRAEVRKHWRRCCVFQKATFSSVPTSSQTQSSTNKPQAQRPFNPNMIPRPPSQIYRHRPDSMMPSM
ncbi:uncharacterized protein LOC119726452 isoform X7 [Patiria miniata]|uniref:Hyalin n=1 Tax=Patiria miniata TaxID=46514 RepID=A0A913ZSJ0_PATMI|nr:uncharacterized protein LOC119726452 isoform X7 [Patiria miniata]